MRQSRVSCQTAHVDRRRNRPCVNIPIRQNCRTALNGGATATTRRGSDMSMDLKHRTASAALREDDRPVRPLRNVGRAADDAELDLRRRRRPVRLPTLQPVFISSRYTVVVPLFQDRRVVRWLTGFVTPARDTVRALKDDGDASSAGLDGLGDAIGRPTHRTGALDHRRVRFRHSRPRSGSRRPSCGRNCSARQ